MTTGVLRNVRIASLGVSLPPAVLTNDEISRSLDTSDEWIRTRTGIRERRIASADVAPSDLAAEAGCRALARLDLDPLEIDLVVSASLVPDMVFPATAAVAAELIGARAAGAFDVQAGCTGFVYALAVGGSAVAAGLARRVLVLGSEVTSRALDWEDRATCVLFGDGAGAAVLVRGDAEDSIAFDLGNDGAGMPCLNMPAGGARMPASEETVRDRQHFLKMNGHEVFRFALRTVVRSCHGALGAAGLGIEEIDLFVPHQANLRIIDSVAERLGLSPDKIVTTLQELGNTSCASIPLCLAAAEEDGRLLAGKRLLLTGFGAGLSWGSCVLTWRPG